VGDGLTEGDKQFAINRNYFLKSLANSELKLIEIIRIGFITLSQTIAWFFNA